MNRHAPVCRLIAVLYTRVIQVRHFTMRSGQSRDRNATGGDVSTISRCVVLGVVVLIICSRR
jgi:hypothetical protein